MEEKPFKVHPGPLAILSLSPGSGQLPTITPSPSPPRQLSLGPGWAQDPRPQPALPSLPNSPRPLASLGVCGPQALAKSSGHRGSGKSSPHDIRNLWTTATLSQPKLNVPLPTVREDSELEGSSVGGKTRWSYNQKAGHGSDGGWEESDDGEDKDNFKPEELDEHALMELEMRRGSSLGGPLEEDDSKTDSEKPSSVSSLNISKHTPHRAYWVEQQSRLPLPLTELMENEALEILTKALRSYRSEIGRDHFLTKQLQRYIEGLKRRRNKRLQVKVI
ncbi:cation channel sperm-associated auxiliary subunit zeta [Balaenoptera ricei]|uniref:cation channel sperm-associated auxiliary subunit zeta n=1 Tax=Balaenoptera ricei TaxID=2746895 RepID=UPI0028BE10A7|nr:cation channel sperm-associated auxiliary subunit zeta [Balaenoptera ricei]